MAEHFTYLFLILVWALPPIILQWIFGWKWLAQHRRAWVFGILIPTIYLSLADATALGVVWTISPAKSTGLFVGNVPIEEILFFLVTNTLVVQSFLLLYHSRDLAGYWQNKFSRG